MPLFRFRHDIAAMMPLRYVAIYAYYISYAIILMLFFIALAFAMLPDVTFAAAADAVLMLFAAFIAFAVSFSIRRRTLRQR